MQFGTLKYKYLIESMHSLLDMFISTHHPQHTDVHTHTDIHTQTYTHTFLGEVNHEWGREVMTEI